MSLLMHKSTLEDFQVGASAALPMPAGANPENADNTPERLARCRAAFELQCFLVFYDIGHLLRSLLAWYAVHAVFLMTNNLI